MTDKLIVEGKCYYHIMNDRLNIYKEIEEGGYESLGRKMAEHFTPELPEGAIWKGNTKTLGKLRITVERIEDVSR